jgi:hypothetical protein
VYKCCGDLEVLLFVFSMDGCDIYVLVIYPLFLFAFWLCLSSFFVYVLFVDSRKYWNDFCVLIKTLHIVCCIFIEYLFSLVGYYLYSMAHVVSSLCKNKTFIFVWAIIDIQQRMLSGCFEGYI